MRRVETSDIVRLQRVTARIRNLCVLAHIDHGKTTLTDSLISSNGIISPRLAGKLRYLDSTEDEQQRGITMQSSAISLLFKIDDKSSPTSEINSDNEFLINLIDSPGHIDFSSDVSTATRLCDGALIVIDVLEGICTQTNAVIYKALKEGLTPCLILNKIDRLCLELQLSTTEAFHHLRRILEQVNALAYTLVTSELQFNDQENGIDDSHLSHEDKARIQDMWSFAPSNGNVLFASACDIWGFGVTKFVNYYARKFSLNRSVLQKYIFEDYSFNVQTSKIIKLDSQNRAAKPMFAEMILDPIWKVYELCMLRHDVSEAARWFAQEVRSLTNCFRSSTSI